MSLNILLCAGLVIGSHLFGTIVGILSTMLVSFILYQCHIFFFRPYLMMEKKDTEIYALMVQLYAKCAKADGQVSRSEIKAMREALLVLDIHIPFVAYVFDVARKRVDGYPEVARRLGLLLENRLGDKKALLEGLHYVAASNGKIVRDQMDFLNVVARMFDINDVQLNTLRHGWGIRPDGSLVHGDGAAKASSGMHADMAALYTLLDLPKDASKADVRRAYRKKVKEYHPDLLRGQGRSEAEISAAEEKLAELTKAYGSVR